MINKKILMCFFGIFVIMMFTSCNNQKNSLTDINNNYLSDAPDFSKEYELNDTKIFDTNKLNCFSLVDKYNKGIIFTGSKYDIDNNFLTLSYNLNNSAQEIIKNTLVIEQEEIIINAMKRYGDKIYILSQYNSQYAIIVCDQNGKEIKRRQLDYYPNELQINNNIYILDNVNSKVHSYSLDLDPVSSYDINLEYDGIKMSPQKICVSDQNDIYCLIQNKETEECKIIKIGDTSEVICDSIDDLNKVDDIYLDSFGNIYIFSQCSSECLVDQLDPNGKIINMFEISNCDKIYGVYASNHIIYSNSEGIYDYFENKERLLISSTEFSDKEIYSLSIDNNQLSVCLNNSNSSNFKENIFEVNQNNKIIEEYPVNNLIDCFVQNDKIYYINQTDNNIEVNIIEKGIVNKTGICFNIDDIATCKIAVLESGIVIISATSKINEENTLIFYNKEFQNVKELSINEPIIDFIKANKKLYCYDSESLYEINDKFEIQKANISLQDFGEDPAFCPGNSTYDFLFSNNTGFYGYKSNDSSYDLLINYSNMGIMDVNEALLFDENKIYLSCITGIYLAQKVKNSNTTPSEKKDITIAYLDGIEYETEKNLLDTVREYNKENNEYNIKLNKYSSTTDNMPVEIFERDLVTGKIPDIIILDQFMNVNTYLKDNLLTDINTMINNDSEVNRDMFNSNILDAFSYDNKLYTMPLIYQFETIQLLVDYKYSNFDELMDQINSNVDHEKYAFDITTSANNILVYLNGKIDKSNNKFNITEDDMKRLVSFNRNYCEGGFKSDYQFDERLKFMIPCYFGDPSSFYQSANLGDVKQIIGYPDVSGVLNPKLAISITEQSPYKEAAWEFVKQFFNKSDDINQSEIEYNVSILKKYAVKPDVGQIPQNYIDEYNRLVEGKWLSWYDNRYILELIASDLMIEDDLTDEEKSKEILNKLEKYYAESK